MHDKEGSQWPLKKHHLTADILVIRSLSSSRGIIWFLQVNQCVLPASSLGIVTGSGLNMLTFCHCPAHNSFQLPNSYQYDHNRPKVLRRWARGAVSLHSLGITLGCFLLRNLWAFAFFFHYYKLNSFPHTSKYKEPGNVHNQGCYIDHMSYKKNTGPKWMI